MHEDITSLGVYVEGLSKWLYHGRKDDGTWSKESLTTSLTPRPRDGRDRDTKSKYINRSLEHARWKDRLDMGTSNSPLTNLSEEGKGVELLNLRIFGLNSLNKHAAG